MLDIYVHYRESIVEGSLENRQEKISGNKPTRKRKKPAYIVKGEEGKERLNQLSVIGYAAVCACWLRETRDSTTTKTARYAERHGKDGESRADGGGKRA